MKSQRSLRILILPVLALLGSCGSDSGPLPLHNLPPGGIQPPVGSSGGGTWQSGVFLPAAQFADRCVAPQAGTADLAGTAADEKNWLRSMSNDLYLWYGEIPDQNPASFTVADYFDELRTPAMTPSGNRKDKFHFTYDTDDWIALSQGGVEAGYGAEFAILSSTPPRRVVVAFTESGTPAAGQLARGDEITTVDGADVVNGNSQQVVNVLNAGLFPEAVGAPHTFNVRNLAGATRTVTLTSASITHIPVPPPSVITSASGPVGYMLFNDHIATSEAALISAINILDTANVTDLVLDMRYNGGGYLDIASELAYMIGNPSLTSGQTFEKTVFNSKHPTRDPVTGDTLAPTGFLNRTQGFSTTAGQPLPNLNLNSVYVIVGPGTCSASEAVINGLMGVDVDVFLIGSTTCGKPYGFYPLDNCGTTYFTIQFRGENADSFGDYTDGFSPANQVTGRGTSLPGCSVADDFTQPLGNQAEARLAAALSFRASNNTVCPTPSGASQPRLAKRSVGSAAADFELSKPASRTNRILRAPRT